MSAAGPIASISLDLDNQWSYMKIHGDSGWQSFPSYLDVVVPRVLRFLKERNLTITFFIVGQDAALEKNADALRAISAAGHEVGNHSFNHESWLHLYSRGEIQTELAIAEEHIERTTGRRPVGFRGPGYSLSAGVLEVLAERGYRYDASTLPTFIGPLSRRYYFRTAKLTADEMRRRAALFGSFRDGFRPLKAYAWRVGGRQLIEIPVTTMPLFRTPIHASYLLYINGYSRAAAAAYFRIALKLCQWSGIRPSLLLHPLDFLGPEDAKELAFFPGMGLPAAEKLTLLSEVFEDLLKKFSPVTMLEHAADVAESKNLRMLDPEQIFNQQELALRMIRPGG